MYVTLPFIPITVVLFGHQSFVSNFAEDRVFLQDHQESFAQVFLSMQGMLKPGPAFVAAMLKLEAAKKNAAAQFEAGLSIK